MSPSSTFRSRLAAFESAAKGMRPNFSRGSAFVYKHRGGGTDKAFKETFGRASPTSTVDPPRSSVLPVNNVDDEGDRSKERTEENRAIGPPNSSLTHEISNEDNIPLDKRVSAKRRFHSSRPGILRGNSFELEDMAAETEENNSRPRPNTVHRELALRPCNFRGDSFVVHNLQEQVVVHEEEERRSNTVHRELALRPCCFRGDSFAFHNVQEPVTDNAESRSNTVHRESALRPCSFRGDSFVVHNVQEPVPDNVERNDPKIHPLRPGVHRGNSFDKGDGDVRAVLEEMVSEAHPEVRPVDYNDQGPVKDDADRADLKIPSLRPGILRGNSFDDDGDLRKVLENMAEEAQPKVRPFADNRSSVVSTSSNVAQELHEDREQTEFSTRKPGLPSGGHFLNEKTESKQQTSEAPRVSGGSFISKVHSMRPGVLRGNSFDHDEDLRVAIENIAMDMSSKPRGVEQGKTKSMSKKLHLRDDQERPRLSTLSLKKTDGRSLCRRKGRRSRHQCESPVDPDIQPEETRPTESSCSKPPANDMEMILRKLQKAEAEAKALIAESQDEVTQQPRPALKRRSSIASSRNVILEYTSQPTSCI